MPNLPDSSDSNSDHGEDSNNKTNNSSNAAGKKASTATANGAAKHPSSVVTINGTSVKPAMSLAVPGGSLMAKAFEDNLGLGGVTSDKQAEANGDDLILSSDISTTAAELRASKTSFGRFRGEYESNFWVHPTSLFARRLCFGSDDSFFIPFLEKATSSSLRKPIYRKTYAFGQAIAEV